jgi:DNA end-binding protein Ku
MVSIPVKLYTATESKDISFHLLHKDCGSRLKQLRWCPVHEREVNWDDIERGYEYAKDEHVILTEDDFASLPLPSKHTIDLATFVSNEEIDPVSYEKSYYLEPEDAGKKPYALLMRALQEKNLTAVAKIAIRNKERLCALRPYDGALVIETLFYPDEIRISGGRVDLDDVKITNKELEMAFSLIDLMSGEYEPEQYRDGYREALMKIIEAKLAGAEIVEAPAPTTGKVVDLMSALKKSVETARGRQEKPAAKGKTKPIAARRKKVASR